MITLIELFGKSELDDKLDLKFRCTGIDQERIANKAFIEVKILSLIPFYIENHYSIIILVRVYEDKNPSSVSCY